MDFSTVKHQHGLSLNNKILACLRETSERTGKCNLKLKTLDEPIASLSNEFESREDVNPPLI